MWDVHVRIHSSLNSVLVVFIFKLEEKDKMQKTSVAQIPKVDPAQL